MTVPNIFNNNGFNNYHLETKVISWDNTQTSLGFGVDWDATPPLAILTHEIAHAWDDYNGYWWKKKWDDYTIENYAISWENRARNRFYHNVPGYDKIYPCKKHQYSNQSWNMTVENAWIYGDAPGRGVQWDPWGWIWVKWY